MGVTLAKMLMWNDDQNLVFIIYNSSDAVKELIGIGERRWTQNIITNRKNDNISSNSEKLQESAQ